jgi:hypothetical protein
MDILHALRRGGGAQMETDSPYNAKMIEGSSRPQTLTEMLDSQIAFHEKKIADLKEAKAAVSPDVEKALNALAKL